MYLIEYKNIDNRDNVIEFNELLPLPEANDMLLAVIERYKEHGNKSKIWYEIIEKGSNEVVYSSRLFIFDEVESLYEVIKSNRRIEEPIKEYIDQIERVTIDVSSSEATEELEMNANTEVTPPITQPTVSSGQDKLPDYEATITTLEEKMKKTIGDLELMREQSEKAELEREEERLKLEEERKEMLASNMALQEINGSIESRLRGSFNISRIFEDKEKWKQYAKQTFIYAKKAAIIIRRGSRIVYVKLKRAIIRYQRNKQKQQVLDLQLKKAKLEFMSELETERNQQVRVAMRKQKKQEKVSSSMQRKEERYLKELRRRKKGNISFGGVLKLLLVVSVVVLIIDYLYNGDTSRLTGIQHQALNLYETIKNALMK
ncbi:hypothetical protein SAMN04488134_1209 [Amphibacillus marinus]|uniref:Uncharacterized protein n=1 Tax=Amphibacillus marinus TaxID=872970 RepID=A0A1H8TVW6_9BACI|nr:hypothetical protein [Amphibacillus marinus]SEO94568.1 hypothetical protein SAMN04488134_1209 [Amphibacillus marinus]